MLDRTQISVRLLDTTIDNLYMLSEAIEKETGNKIGVGKAMDIVVHQLFGTVGIATMIEHVTAYEEELLSRKPRSENKRKKTAGMNEGSVL